MLIMCGRAEPCVVESLASLGAVKGGGEKKNGRYTKEPSQEKPGKEDAMSKEEDVKTGGFPLKNGKKGEK